MRLAFALAALVACATPAYRDVNGEPVALYWQCREDSPHPVMYEHGRTKPCPDLSEVWCADATGARQRFVIAGHPPVDASTMCARIQSATR